MSGGFGGYDVFFELRSRDAWSASDTWHDGLPANPARDATGTKVGAELTFDLTASKTVELEVGVSLVSQAGATANLAAELPTFDFDGARKKTRAEWQALLDTVKVAGGTDAERRIFATALYHAFLMPTRVGDADGSYLGQDKMLHSSADFHYVSDMSLWDTYRTLHPLYALIAPDRARDAVRSLVEMARQSGHFSRWPIATGEAGTMVGASADIVIADAQARGVGGFDALEAWGMLRAAALDATPPPGGRGPREPADGYMKLGYVPASSGRSVSVTSEFAHDDFALATLARALGQTADADALVARSHGYRQLFDPQTGFLWSKDATGGWASPHGDPITMSSDFVEANAWQSVWMEAHDADGLAQLFGGRDQFIAKLSEFFENSRQNLVDDGQNRAQRSLPRPYYWHGNEPDLHAPYLFAQAGRPDLTQKWVRWVMDGLYSDRPDGLAGNDDGGTLSSWYVWSALGLYPLPGSDRLIVGTPLFHRAEIAVAGGTFTIEAPNAYAPSFYVQSVTLDGKPLDHPELRQTDLHPGGVLHFELGPSPAKWGQ
jgi:predicted alpha-1,2-mannosidase